jgi:hypothetical protein
MDSMAVLGCYAGMGFALSLLRWRQGLNIGDAAFRGLFWPAEILRGWLELPATLAGVAGGRAAPGE